jgi:hypothetical protein
LFISLSFPLHPEKLMNNWANHLSYLERAVLAWQGGSRTSSDGLSTLLDMLTICSSLLNATEPLLSSSPTVAAVL